MRQLYQLFISSGLMILLALIFTSCEKTQDGQAWKDIPVLSPRAGEVQPSAEFLKIAGAVDNYRDRIIKNPQAVKNYTALANLFLQESRMSGNHHEYLPKAMALINRAKTLAPEDFTANVTHASVLMIQHRFKAAQQMTEKAIAANPHSAYAYGVLCDAYLELGEYEKAVAVCDKMLSIRPDLRSYARASFLRELHGDHRGAIKAMEMAANAGVPGGEPRAWALYQLGNLYRNSGALDTAAYIYAGILTERPAYPFAKQGLASIKSAQQEYAEAIDLLIESIKLMPDHSSIELLAAIYREMGAAENEAKMIKTAQQLFLQHEAEGWNINLEYAQFCLSHEIELTGALARAEKEYQQRPGNIEVQAAYARALYENGQVEAAIPHIEQAMRLESGRSDWHYLAGIIYHAAGDNQAALKNLEQTLAQHNHQRISQLEHARQMIASIRGLASREF